MHSSLIFDQLTNELQVSLTPDFISVKGEIYYISPIYVFTMTTVPVKSLSVEWCWMDVVAPTWQMAGVGVLGSLGGVWAQVQHIIRSETPASIGAATTSNRAQ